MVAAGAGAGHRAQITRLLPRRLTLSRNALSVTRGSHLVFTIRGATPPRAPQGLRTLCVLFFANLPGWPDHVRDGIA